jgi:hypothetical protein
MGSQTLLALKVKRAEVSEWMRLLDARPSARASLATGRLMERFRLKAEWLDKRIDLELRQSRPAETPTAGKVPRPVDAA